MQVDRGWTWKFDEDLPDSLRDAERQPDDYAKLSLPVGLIHGADSALFCERTRAYMQEMIQGETPVVAVPDARHHLFLDQPLAFIAAVQEMCRSLG